VGFTNTSDSRTDVNDYRTRPSIYYIINSVSAHDFCRQDIGPVQTNLVISKDLTDVSTLVASATYGSKPQQLHLNDLRGDCPTVQPEDIDHHNHVVDSIDGCNPVLAFGADVVYAAAK
jgi:hypothetical protein